MKIGMLANAANRHTHRWCTWLANRGHDVVLFSDDAPRDDMNYGSVRCVGPNWGLIQKVVTFKLNGGTYANNRDKWKAYQRTIESERPDVLHAQDALRYGPMLPHFPKFPRVLTPWGRDVDGMGTETDPWRDRLVLQSFYAADVISTNAPGQEKQWAERTGTEQEKFQLFAWGVDCSLFKRAFADEVYRMRARFAIGEKKRMLLSPRIASDFYGTDMLLEAWGRWLAILGDSDRGKDMVLAVMRGGGTEEYWNRLKGKYGDLKSVRWIGDYMTPLEMTTLYSSSDGVAMLPETDLLAMSLLESMSCGCIPVVADLPCYKAALKDFEHQGRSDQHGTGMVLSERSVDGLVEGFERWRMLSDEARHDAISLNQYVVKMRFEWNRCAMEMEEVYRRAQKIFAIRSVGACR